MKCCNIAGIILGCDVNWCGGGHFGDGVWANWFSLLQKGVSKLIGFFEEGVLEEGGRTLMC